MYQSQAQVPLLPPPERLSPGDDYLQPRGVADWLMSPWLSERTRCLILPLDMVDTRVLLCWDGLAMVRLRRDASLRLQGRTGSFGSVLAVARAGKVTSLKGFLDDQTVDYAVEEEEDALKVDGDTGAFRSRYTVRFQEGEVHLAGDHGQFDSNCVARFAGDGSVHVEGVRDGERIDLHIKKDGSSVLFEGPFLGGHSEFVLAMQDAEWNLAGHVAGEVIQVALRLAEDGVEVVGSIPQGSVNFKLFRSAEGFWVRGKSNNFHLNYRLILQRDT